MKLKKEEAKNNFIDMIKNSWTYEKLTEQEKRSLQSVFNSNQCKNALKGDYNARWEILQLLYTSFINGCGYNNDPEWRSIEKVTF